MPNPIIKTEHDGDAICWEVTYAAAADYVAVFGPVDDPLRLLDDIARMLRGARPGRAKLRRDHVDLWRADWRHYHVRLIAQPMADGNRIRLARVVAPDKNWRPRPPKAAAATEAAKE